MPVPEMSALGRRRREHGRRIRAHVGRRSDRSLIRILRTAAIKIGAAAINGGISAVAVHELMNGATWHVFIAAAGTAALPIAAESAKRIAEYAQRLRWPDPHPPVH